MEFYFLTKLGYWQHNFHPILSHNYVQMIQISYKYNTITQYKSKCILMTQIDKLFL
jgi:hypothetical protein